MMSEAADAPARLLRFDDEMNACIAACLDRIRTEEVEILQLAERVPTGAAWAELDAAFSRTAIRSPAAMWRQCFAP